jgi:hypothetical protein
MLPPKKGTKKCFWCGKHACRNLWDSWYVLIHNRYVCAACELWDLEERCAGRPGLQKPTKDGARQLTLMFPVAPRKEAVVLTAAEFMEHIKGL